MTVSTPPESGNLSEEERIAARNAVIEADYCAGIKTLRQIGSDHGISHAAVAKMAKAKGWVRNLQAAIQAKADAKVAKAAVTAQVNEKRRVETESAVVEANATLQYQVRMRHRGAIGKLMSLVDSLTGELEAQSVNPEELKQALIDVAHPVGEGEEANDRRQRARQAMEKVIGTPGRISSLKTLAETVEKLVKLERQAFGIEAGSAEDDPSSAAGAAAAAAAGAGRSLSDAERAVRLARLLAKAPAATETPA